jgi:phosphohistidine phosphatase SixA
MALALRRLSCAALAVLAVATAPTGGSEAGAQPTAEPRLGGQALVAALRRGGYVVYFRHAATDFSITDTDTPDLADCSRQRNLIAAGRADARAIGKAWRMLRLPVGLVLASRYCRTRETARLAFGRFTPSSDITGLPSAATDAERARRVAALRRLLARPPRQGNTILVAHLFNIQEAAGISLEEGEAAVFRPRRARGFRLVAKVLPRAWARLVR